MHLGDPVPQRIHDQLKCPGIPDIERVAAAGGVDVAAGGAGFQPVVCGIVQAAEAERGTHLAGLGRVVEDDVEQHLEARRVQGVHHGLELGDLAAGPAGPHRRRVAVVRREVPDRVVAPVVRQPALRQEALRHVLVHRQQFDSCHAEVGQVGDRGLVPEPGVAAAQLGGHAWMAHREPFDVHLVDDRVGVAAPERAAIGPCELPVHDEAAWHVPGGVERARRARVVRRVAQHLGPEGDLAADRLGVRVEQQFRRVAAQAPGRIVRAGYPVPVCLPGPDPGHETMPHAGVVVLQRYPGFGARTVEQAQRHRIGHAGGHGEVRAVSRRGRAERELAARPGAQHPGFRDGGHVRTAWLRMSLITSPMERTAPCRRRIRSAITPVQPV